MTNEEKKEVLRKAISEILNDEALRKAMEIASYSKFQDNFTLQKMWTGHKTIYKKLLSK